MSATDLDAARLGRLRSAMRDEGVGRLVLTGPEAVLYATGFSSVSAGLFRGYTASVMVTDDDVWLVAPAAESAPVAEDTAVGAERFVPFGTFYFEATSDSPLVSMSGRHASHREALIALVGSSDATLDDRSASAIGRPVDGHGDRVFQAARRTKLPAEVDLLERSAQIADAAIQAGIAAIRRGVSERDLASVVASEMASQGALPRFTVVTTGTRSALADVQPSDTVVEVGDLVRFDVGCTFQGYWSDLGRTAVVGPPSRLQAERYRAIHDGLERELEVVRPGVAASQVFDTAVAAVEGLGLSPYRRHHCGHGIGLEVYEPPIVAPGVERVLEPGMTFCFETPFYALGWGGMMVEDAIVVTDDGYDLLNHSSRELVVVEP